MNLKTIIFFIIGIYLQICCGEYLDLKGNNSRAIPTTLDDLQALLDDTPRMNQQRTPSMVEVWADDYFLPQNRYESLQADFQRMYLWQLDVYNHPNDWSSAYQPIYNANFCLEGLGKLERTSSNGTQFDQIMGASLFYRSYYYLQLLWAFSPAYDENVAEKDIGIVLKMDTDFNTPSVRSNVSDCYQQIIMDTERAIEMLPKVASIPTRPSKIAAHTLLARTYLSMRKYEEAREHANNALLINDELMDYNSTSDGVNSGRSWTFDKYNKETIFYSEVNTNPGNMFVGAPIDTVLLDSYAGTDLRKSCFFTKSGEYFTFKGSYATNRMFSGLATDELFLIRAESNARIGNRHEAMDDLNMLLRTRYDNTLPYQVIEVNDSEEAIAVILSERRKQLLMRGLRFIDIKRLNKEGHNITITRKIGNKTWVLDSNRDQFILPIPHDLRPFVK